MTVPVSVSSADFDSVFESCSLNFCSVSGDSNSLSYGLVKRFENRIEHLLKRLTKMVNTDKHITRVKILLITGIVVSWLTIWVFFLSPIGLIIWIGILAYILFKKSGVKWYLLLSSWFAIPFFSFSIATADYITGKGTLMYMGMPGFTNLDRETRIKSIGSGCVPVGYEPFVFFPNNFALRLWTKIFGYQTGTYCGVYPTVKEAREIIINGDTVEVTKHLNYHRFNVDNFIINLDTNEYNGLSRGSSSVNFDYIVAKSVNNECIVFQSLLPDTNNFETIETIFLLDIKTQNIFARFIEYYDLPKQEKSMTDRELLIKRIREL